MAEGVGFEPTEGTGPSTAFKAAAFVHSATPPFLLQLTTLPCASNKQANEFIRSRCGATRAMSFRRRRDGRGRQESLGLASLDLQEVVPDATRIGSDIAFPNPRHRPNINTAAAIQRRHTHNDV